MKRRWSLFLGILLVISMFVGCTGGADSTTGTGNAKVKIEFWHVFSENYGGDVLHSMVDEFNQSQDRIEVVERYNPNMYPGLMQNLQAEVASGGTPAVTMMGYNYLKYFDANFKYTAPEDLIEKYFAEDKEYLNETFLPNILELAQVDGRQVGLPYAISTPVLLYNPDLFEKAGLGEGPTTWDQIVEYANTIKEKTGEYGFYIQEYADNWAMEGLLKSNGADILSEDGKAVFASEESKEVYESLAGMVLDTKSALHITADEGIQSFVNGKIGMIYVSSAKLANIEEGAAFEVQAVESPVFGDKERRIPAGGNFLTVLAQEEEQQKAAWEFMKFVFSPKWIAEWSKGTGYLPSVKGVAENPEGLKSYIEENKLFGTAMAEMPIISPWTSFPNDIGVEAEQIFANTRDIILSGETSAEQALQDAQDKINGLLG